MNADHIVTWLPITLRTERIRRNWSQSELAKESGIGWKTISSFETGERIGSIKLLQLLAIAKAFGLPAWVLLTEPSADARTLFVAPNSRVSRQER